ncbi:MAG TPA: fumarate hydratase, partial [Beijerinckiaceae bacterium]|nr:fumarate hydratase [Beijerinckiaceae bacterium]
MSAATAAFSHELFPLGPDATPYRKLTADGVRVERLGAREVVTVEREAIRGLAEEAMVDINHLLRPGHLRQLAAILDDPEATGNDKFVAYDLLKNANIAAGGVLPMCQDTGTAIVMGKKGRHIFTDGDDEAAIAQGIRDAYLKKNLRYSQVAPLSMFEEVNTRSNLPAQIEIYAEGEDAYKFLFVAKGGGSANKTFLFQATPALLTRDRLMPFLKERILTLGTAACPPYHLAIVIGGLTAEQTLKTVKLASTRYLDGLPTQGSEAAHAFRDLEMEAEVHRMTQALGVGAQFGGKYFCHDVRVIRLARHGASLPIGLGVSCSADRQALGKITREGVFLEALERNPAQYLPDIDESALGGEVVRIDLNRPMPDILGALTRHPIRTRLALDGPMIVARDAAHAKIRERLERDPARFLPEVTDQLDDTPAVRIDLNRPMADILAELSKYPVKTRVMLSGPMVVARDIAHAKIKERLDRGEGLPQYLKDHAVYYAGPAKTPAGYASGSFGPTTAGR